MQFIYKLALWMKQGWNGRNHNDSVCFRRVYSIYYFYGSCCCSLFLDKQMTTFITEDVLNAMDAYRLADMLEEGPNVPRTVAAKMLRMQADEISALRKQINELQRIL